MKHIDRFPSILAVIFLTITQASQISAQWEQVIGPWPPYAINTNFISRGNNLYGEWQGSSSVWLFLSSDNGKNWIQVDSSYYQSTFFFKDTTILLASPNGWFRSIDNGIDWIPINSPLPNINFPLFAVIDKNLFVGTRNGVFLSTDDGTSWTHQMNSGLASDTTIQSLMASGNYLFVSGYHGVYRSSNNGTSWTLVDSLYNPANVITALTAIYTNLFVGWSNNFRELIMSTDNGKTWIQPDSSLTNTHITSWAVTGTKIFLSTQGGLFLSTNNGVTWIQLDSGLTNSNTGPLIIIGNNLFVGTADGLFLSTNDGTSWSEVDSGLTYKGIATLTISGPYLIAGLKTVNTQAGIIVYGDYERPLSEMITSVKNGEKQIPTIFSLAQNYPNPFNPTTVINYELPTNTTVVLKIFDILGREVETLVNERQSIGDHSVQFNASNLPSGVYFYRIQAGNYNQTKKLLFLK
jgi:photosystem II stability/assembly factor-like uncharacterized protein